MRPSCANELDGLEELIQGAHRSPSPIRSGIRTARRNSFTSRRPPIQVGTSSGDRTVMFLSPRSGTRRPLSDGPSNPSQADCLPLEWVIVSDGSTDETDDIVREAAAKHPWIRLLAAVCTRQAAVSQRSFTIPKPASATWILQTITRHLGLLDADVTFQTDYFEQLMRAFRRRARTRSCRRRGHRCRTAARPISPQPHRCAGSGPVFPPGVL